MTNLYPRLCAWVELPAFGYSVFSEEYSTPPSAPPYGTFCEISPGSFGLTSLRSADFTELLAKPLGLVVIADPSDTWGQGVNKFRDEIGRPTIVSSHVVEDGPVMRVVRQKLRWQQSEIAVDISLFPEQDIVQLHFTIDWNEHQQILKLEVPTAFHNPRVYAAAPGAIVQGTPDGSEEPCQDWIAVEGTLNGRDYTVCVLNDSTYSYDCLDGLLRNILIRSAPYTWNSIPDRSNPNAEMPKDNINPWQDQGRQERTFWILGRSGRCGDQHLDRLSQQLQRTTEYVMDSKHSGTEPWEKSFLEIEPASISVLSLKRAEEAPGLILRIQERSGNHTMIHLKSSFLKFECDVEIAPWEIKTLRIMETDRQQPAISTIRATEI